MLKSLYAKVLTLAARDGAPWWLFAIAFAESSVFPVPPDLLLAPMVVSRPARALRIALIATAGSVLGGALGYAIGYFLYDQFAQPIIAFYGYGPALDRFIALYRDYGAWVILLKGVTPIPYKIVTIASGAAHYDFAVFMALSAVTRGGRFFLEAIVLRRFGPGASVYIERHLPLALAGIVFAGLLGFAVLRYV